MWTVIGIFVAGMMIGGSLGAVLMALIAAGNRGELLPEYLEADWEPTSPGED
ncbi:MAG TPA: hypothetical protein IAC15_00855 [Candidatus Onthomonas avicola]|nr:hypothetical protein [Candidatus Onthomonas avicola]